MMDDRLDRMRTLTVLSFEHLLGLYPPRFRNEFACEIHQVCLLRMHEAGRESASAWFTAAAREFLALAQSILQESWNELWSGKGDEMEEESIAKSTGGGDAVLQQVGLPGRSRSPGLLWVVGWVLLVTAAFPAAVFLSSSFAMIFMGILSLGALAGLWHIVDNSIAQGLGVVSSLAVCIAAAQTVMMRSLLRRPWTWFAVTAGGVAFSGLVIWLGLLAGLLLRWDSFWIVAAAALAMGGSLGVGHWLYLRREISQAAWIIPIDVLGMASVLLSRPYITTYIEPLALVFIALPGFVTGLGLSLLIRLYPAVSRTHPPVQVRWLRRIAWVGLGLVCLVPIFFFSIWAFASSQLALAKSGGVYPTIEEAVIGNNSQGWDGAQVVRVTNIRTGPNRRDGTQPHVWFGTATIKLDRVPEGHTRAEYMSGSYYIHVRDGWVLVPEGAFPEFVGWVMEFYNLEGARDFKQK